MLLLNQNCNRFGSVWYLTWLKVNMCVSTAWHSYRWPDEIFMALASSEQILHSAKWLFFKITEWIKYHKFWLQAEDSFSSAVLHFNRHKKYNINHIDICYASVGTALRSNYVFFLEDVRCKNCSVKMFRRGSKRPCLEIGFNLCITIWIWFFLRFHFANGTQQFNISG